MSLEKDHIAVHQTFTTLAPYTGTWDNNAIVHLLKRTMFGATKKDIDHLKKLSLSEAVDALLSPAPFTKEPPLNDYDFVNTQNVPPGTTWVNAPYYILHDAERGYSLARWSMETFIEQDLSLREKMTLFWHNHFATQTNIYVSKLIWKHHSLLRENALGNFKIFAKKVTLDCHMLRYLNGEENTKLAPNENYGRELQELFCIGKGPEAKFTEDDVKQSAKVLTGWKANWDTAESYFKEEEHDTSDKKFSTFYNNKIIKGRSGADGGIAELNDLLDMIFDNNETALFICRKLYRWFVYYEIDDAIEKKIIAPLAQTLRKNDYEIKPVLKKLFTSEHFFDKTKYGVQVKSPLDFIVGMQREFNVQYAPKKNYISNYSMYAMLLESASLMGQAFPDPPNVSGWPAYYQSPGFYDLWINTSTYPARNEFSTILINYGFNREGIFYAVNVVEFAKALHTPHDPDALINESLEILYRVPISDAAKKMLKKNTLLSGQEQDHYWTDAWNEHLQHPEDEGKKAILEIRLKALYQFITNSPEYQLT